MFQIGAGIENATPPERPLTAEYIDAWAVRLYSDPKNSGVRHQVIANYVEAVGRLVLKSEQIASKAGFYIKPTFVNIPPAATQHEIYDLYESYFQGLYKTLSSLAAITSLYPETYNRLPARSMKRFLDAVAKLDTDIAPACDLLEQTRKYRTLLDHPAGAPVSNWISFRHGGGYGLQIIFYGYKNDSGEIPGGAEEITFPFPTDADWVFNVPFVPYANQALRDLTDVLFEKLAKAT
ncbi:hypothetical protein NtRootA4_32120 [Arthrobacter sp. NtRootA4]|nr:hypothetical protein NtRootA2_34320 [Arthrobacter sp. NtRootA2]BCW16233.1 hypothetical protein NtRootA4_32120 [Arthrobacter sp. NtRootA4]BCW24565.1 hypothetical protein NtRootC7_34320 [Arthrobacter sp. NtRootC7]BCW28835.1 hypothetical protein NtRootC45_34350 [Arthrobacter sp. NtRootC45]BCW33105.1 hypothetical protein NtRootD5_34360 [Arthrobacter sp. NtRootD5]